MVYAATPGVDYGSVLMPITVNPGDSRACFEIVIVNDDLFEEKEECFLVSFTTEALDNLEITNSDSVWCIIDDDSKEGN